MKAVLITYMLHSFLICRRHNQNFMIFLRHKKLINRMKNKILLVVFLLTSSGSYAQSVFGIKGGLNHATIVGDASGVDPKNSFHVGAFVIIKSSEKFAVMPEVVYSQQGAQISGNGNFKVNYDYLNLPLMLTFFPTQSFFLQAGPQVGFLLSAEVTDGKNSENVKDQLNSTDLGLGFGVGGDFKSVIIQARINAGLSNTAKNAADGEKFPNQVIQLSIGFKLN